MISYTALIPMGFNVARLSTDAGGARSILRAAEIIHVERARGLRRVFVKGNVVLSIVARKVESNKRWRLWNGEWTRAWEGNF